MNTTNSTLGLFALRSYVSVLPETQKEIALKIVGGGKPGDPNIHYREWREHFDHWFEHGCDNNPFAHEAWIKVDKDGYLIDQGCTGSSYGDANPYDNIIGPNEWEAIKRDQDENDDRNDQNNDQDNENDQDNKNENEAAKDPLDPDLDPDLDIDTGNNQPPVIPPNEEEGDNEDGEPALAYA